MSLLLIFAVWQHKHIQHEAVSSVRPQSYAVTTLSGQAKNKDRNATAPEENSSGNINTTSPRYTGTLPKPVLPDSIVAYGLKLMGSPYLIAGISSNGFDCSGFIYHIFNKYGVDLPHASTLLAKKGEPISLNEAKKGDLLIFTGTSETDKTPGHVGVVITKPGEPIEFVHASSEGGVKISKVAGTGYEKRYLQARRVL